MNSALHKRHPVHAHHQPHHPQHHDDVDQNNNSLPHHRRRRKRPPKSTIRQFFHPNNGLLAFGTCFLVVCVFLLIALPHLKIGKRKHASIKIGRGLIDKFKKPTTSTNNNNNSIGNDGNINLRRPIAFQDPLSQKNNVVGNSSSYDASQTITHRKQQSKCHDYGCPIYPMEVSKIKESSINSNTHTNTTQNSALSLLASKNHILITHQSNRKKPRAVNQDRAVLIAPFGNDNIQSTTNEQNEEESSETMTMINSHDNFFLGLFDGHGDEGEVIAQFSSEQIPSRIFNKLFQKEKSILAPDPFNNNNNNNNNNNSNNNTAGDDVIKQAIIQSFVETDRDSPPTQAMTGGCTAIALLRIGNILYMANTGDSTYFIVLYHPPPNGIAFDSNNNNNNNFNTNNNYNIEEMIKAMQQPLQGTITIHHTNRRDKPHLPEEQSRIQKLGGRIHIPPIHPMGSRVVVFSSVHREDIGLAMSRSIGDWEWGKVGVIPDPIVEAVDLRGLLLEKGDGGNGGESGVKMFVVAGSDGLFDIRKAEFVAKNLARGFFESIEPPPPSPLSSSKSTEDAIHQELHQRYNEHVLNVARQLVTAASPRKPEQYRDDISFVSMVVDL